MKKFMLKYTKPKSVAHSTTLLHRFLREQGEYNSTPAIDLFHEWLNGPQKSQIQKHFDQLKKDGVMYNRSERTLVGIVKVKDIHIDEDVQRKLDHKHVLSIGSSENFKPPLMSIITGTKDSKGICHAGNGQHTLVYEVALAYNNLWWDYQGDIGELEVPFAYIETDDRSILRIKWTVDNGITSKKPSPYDHHRIDVLCYRLDGKQDPTDFPEYRQSHLIQKICEDEGYEPISEFDIENIDHPRAILHVSEMRKYRKTPEKREAWRFVLRTHKKHWPNRQLHIMEITLFADLYRYMADEVDMYSSEFQKEFMEPFIAIIQHFFKGGPNNLQSESISTFTKWYAKEWDLDPIRDKEDISIDKVASLVLMLKLYRALGGTYKKLPSIVNNFNSNKTGDLIDYLPNNIRTVLVNGK